MAQLADDMFDLEHPDLGLAERPKELSDKAMYRNLREEQRPVAIPTAACDLHVYELQRLQQHALHLYVDLECRLFLREVERRELGHERADETVAAQVEPHEPCEQQQPLAVPSWCEHERVRHRDCGSLSLGLRSACVVMPIPHAFPFNSRERSDGRVFYVYSFIYHPILGYLRIHPTNFSKKPQPTSGLGMDAPPC